MSDTSKTSAGLLIVISAPSGGGKTTLCEQIILTNANATRVITCTTRAPRDGEKNGIDYYFLDSATFQAKVAAGEFLEHATVYGNSYGTLRSEVLNKVVAGKDVLLSIDVQGAATLRAKASEHPVLRSALVSVFITPPTLKHLEERLVRRGKDSAEVMQKRLSVAKAEIAEWRKFDYLIISTSIPEDVRQMQAILVAERLRQFRAIAPEA